MKNLLQQVKMRKKNKDKRGISEIIGYVLLIVGAVAMGAIVFSWLKTYIPTEKLECPDDVSLFVKESSCVIDTSTLITTLNLNLNLKNNGKFNIDGYFIRGALSGEEQATQDLSEYLSSGGTIEGGEIRFCSDGISCVDDNPFAPNSPEFSSI